MLTGSIYGGGGASRKIFDIWAKISRNLMVCWMLIVGYMRSVLNFNRKEVYIRKFVGGAPKKMFDIFAKISRNLMVFWMLIEGYMKVFLNVNRKYILGGLGAELKIFDICAKTSRNLMVCWKLIVGYMRSVLNFNRKEVYILGGLGAEPQRKCLIFALKLVEISVCWMLS